VALRPVCLQFIHNGFVSLLAFTFWLTCISTSSMVGARGL